MRFWQSIAFTEADQLMEVAKICDEVGFDGVMMSDHLLHFERLQSRYPYSADGMPPWSSPETVWPECWSMFAAMAAVTQRIRFITNVYILPLRNPIEVAKATSSVAAFFEGRLILGAGAGWMKEEFDVLGVDFETRGQRFNECIDVLRRLWSGDMVEHHGRFFDFPRMRMWPAPRAPIPIYIGGMSPAALRRAARLGDGWLGAGQTPEQALETVRQLQQLRAQAGRSGEPFDIVAPLTVPPQLDTLKRLQDAGVGGAVSDPFTFTIGPTSTLAQKRAYLEGYANSIIAKLKKS
jgi:probable F420-dependent oxidoreductase